MLKLSNIRKDYEAGDTVVHALKGIDLEFPATLLSMPSRA